MNPAQTQDARLVRMDLQRIKTWPPLTPSILHKTRRRQLLGRVREHSRIMAARDRKSKVATRVRDPVEVENQFNDLRQEAAVPVHLGIPVVMSDRA